jgi:sulfate adenylyltransferase
LREGLDIPAWFSYPTVVEELRRAHPPKHKQGFTIFFTGLSGSGKSTVANALMVKLLEEGSRPVTLLDGDIVRNTAISTSSASVTLPVKSPRTAALQFVRPSRRTQQRVAWFAR